MLHILRAQMIKSLLPALSLYAGVLMLNSKLVLMSAIVGSDTGVPRHINGRE